jgi:hypothetical protein
MAAETADDEDSTEAAAAPAATAPAQMALDTSAEPAGDTPGAD